MTAILSGWKQAGILWYVNPLLGSDRQAGNYTTAIAPQTSMFPWQWQNTAIMKEMLSMQSMLTCYDEDQDQDQLAVAVT
jgi:hypothetical protein